MKTFWGWLDRQLPDGTVIWTSPCGQTYTTHPGSRLLFPSLCRPTAPVVVAANDGSTHPNRGLMMPRRNTTREHDRAKRVEAERARNREIRSREISESTETTCDDPYFASRPPPPDSEDPPPF